MTQYAIQDVIGDSPAWMSFIWISFTVSMALMIVGIYDLAVN